MIGKEVYPNGNGMIETTWWTGKPWRRITLLVNDFYWKGERTERSWGLSFHLGSRRFGWGITVDLIRSPAMDYTEESP